MSDKAEASAAEADVKEVTEKVSKMDVKDGAKKDKAQKKKAKKQKGGAGDAGKADIPLEMDPRPEYLDKRLELFEQLYKQQEEELAKKERFPITVTLPDGAKHEGTAWETKPIDIAEKISEGFARDVVVAKVNGELWDLDRALEDNCNIQFLKFDDDEGRETFWHSSAHLLGLAMELHLGGSLCYGPPIQDGFFYDTYLGDKSINEENFGALEKLVNQAVKQKLPFQRLVVKKEDLLKMFEYNEFKTRIIKERIQEPATTVYRCGPLIDLCHGPHVRNTGKIKAFTVTKSSSTYWEGKADAESLQRVYAISFPDKNRLKEWKKLMEEAAKRDHRRIGKEQELFFFHEMSPGSCFFLPKGALIYNRLMDFIKSEYIKRDFSEAITPNIFSSKLWETSGHWQHYADNMFQFECDEQTYALKPMNCPSHCLMFGHRIRSYKELPLRIADFGVLHRNELAGALTGLTRVRRFQQDDAHIFCMPEQIEDEIRGCIDFLECVYKTFGFTFQLNLSTRPEKFLGDIETWNEAEAALATALDASGHEWQFNHGDGAFYGPKIDITVLDALRRPHQCATIQLDFQLPQRFELEYVPAEKEEGKTYRPVIIHRAILGSVERMIAILIEHYAGKWPFWLSPRQAIVIPVHPRFDDYAEEVARIFSDLAFSADTDVDDGTTLQKKIRNAQIAQYNFILVVGEQERDHRTVNVRTRDGGQHGEHAIDQLISHFNKLRSERRLSDVFDALEEADHSSVTVV